MKRAFDIIFSTFALILLAVPMLFLAILVHVYLGSPVIFRQTRPGRHGKFFEMFKFRTMTETRDSDGILLSDSERLTPLGFFLRRTSLDELPELLNVIRGDMSLVGPRPLLVRYLPFYTDEENLRHSVRPGITGWAQVNGRNWLGWDERLSLDVWYVNHLSFSLDLKILLLTLRKVIMREDVVVAADSVMKNLDEERSGRGSLDD